MVQLIVEPEATEGERARRLIQQAQQLDDEAIGPEESPQNYFAADSK